MPKVKITFAGRDSRDGAGTDKFFNMCGRRFQSGQGHGIAFIKPTGVYRAGLSDHGTNILAVTVESNLLLTDSTSVYTHGGYRFGSQYRVGVE